MKIKRIPIKFGIKFVLFIILLETITVPGVAYANYFIGTNLVYVGLMGFFVAFAGISLIVLIIKNWVIKNSEKLFGIKIASVTGVKYLGVLSGILLAIMFLTQTILYNFGFRDYSAGFISGIVSVGISLIIYQFLALVGMFAIGLITENQNHYKIEFAIRDIIILAVLFGVFELIVCPITGIWMNYSEVSSRLLAAVITGFLSGFIGGCVICFISNVLRVKTFLILRKL